mgnify:FL=1
MGEPLAHSARPRENVPAQSYVDHVRNVLRCATEKSNAALNYCSGDKQAVIRAIHHAAEYHDLGKLDEKNQEVLRSVRRRRSLAFNHTDAGVALLLRKSDPFGASLVYSHHQGLPDFPREQNRGPGRALRDIQCPPEQDVPVKDRTDSALESYFVEHRGLVEDLPGTSSLEPVGLQGEPVLFRIALSCLVDADHQDTAQHYGATQVGGDLPLYPQKRLDLLDAYVDSLGGDQQNAHTRLLNKVYQTARGKEIQEHLIACDSPVGTGKTTAVMAHMLKVAAQRGLRRIFVVLRFRDIVTQAVDGYRKARALSGEKPEKTVAAHHHRAEYEAPESREFAFLWNSPIVVTTAVQFFETLASNRPSALRKLHQLPGSAIFFDEAHAALRAHLWPKGWDWLKKLAGDWNCHCVLGSGSLSRFWQLEEFSDPPNTLPNLLPKTVREKTHDRETSRIQYRTRQRPLTADDLVQWTRDLPGPRLLILNTVQSAAAIASMIAENQGQKGVEHISTALCPRDRDCTLKRVKSRLKDEDDLNWTLVATSCVEAGVDVSFRTGLRERCSLNSLVQTSGRVNRKNKFSSADVWDFRLRHDPPLVEHPAFRVSAKILGGLFEEGRVGAESSTEAMRREVRHEGLSSKAQVIEKADENCDFPRVAKNFVVIDSDTATAIVDEELVARIEAGDHVDTDEFQSVSVEISRYRVHDYAIEAIRGYRDLWAWKLGYDGFLGYMAGVLKLAEHQEGGSVV